MIWENKFMLMPIDFMPRAIDELTKPSLRLLGHMMSQAKMGTNMCFGMQIDFAEEMAVKKSSVSKSVIELVSKNYIIKILRKGYMLNPMNSFSGTEDQQYKALAVYKNQRKKGVDNGNE